MYYIRTVSYVYNEHTYNELTDITNIFLVPAICCVFAVYMYITNCGYNELNIVVPLSSL